MNQLAVLLCIVVAQCVAKRNATDVPLFCEEYANCLAKANRKSAECLEENTTAIVQNSRKRCAGAAELHAQLQALYDERNAEVESCVREEADNVSAFSPRKIEKCKMALKKSKRSASADPLERRMKRKDRTKERKDKPKSCVKEAKKQRLQCAKIAKCCGAVKSCQDRAVQKSEILAKKKQLKRLYDTCHVELRKKKLSKKQPKDGKVVENDDETDKKATRLLKKRSRLNEKLEESQERKRTAPIQTKVLEEVGQHERAVKAANNDYHAFIHRDLITKTD
ncbi:hypothetical protein OSTOST_04401 [Ostertagia ostertagi]